MLNRITGLAAAATLALAGIAGAQSYSLEGAGTASLTGIVPQMLAPFAAEEGVDVQVVLGQTLTKSALKLAAGQIDMAVIPPSALGAMKAGEGPYAAQGAQAAELAGNVRALFGFPGGTFHVIAWADSGIEDWADLAGHRVYVGPPAGAANAQMRGMIRAVSGLEDGTDYEGIRAPWGASMQAFQDGQFDVLIASLAIGQQALNELSLQREIRILGIPRDVLDSPDFHDFLAGQALDTSEIPAGTYSGQANADADLMAVNTTMLFGVNAAMEDDVAYAMTKAYWDHLPQMKAQNALLRSIDETRPFVNLNAPLHPGAVRYYEETGIEVPDGLMP